MAWAFLLNAATGVLLFIADATTKSKQPVFYIKLSFIFVALLVHVLPRGDSSSRIPGTRPGESTPPRAALAGGRVAAPVGRRNHRRPADGVPVRSR